MYNIKLYKKYMLLMYSMFKKYSTEFESWNDNEKIDFKTNTKSVL